MILPKKGGVYTGTGRVRIGPVSHGTKEDSMRHIPSLAVIALAACVDDAPTSEANGNAELKDQATAGGVAFAREDAPPIVYNTTLRSENEPNGASTSESKGFAQVKILPSGTIEFRLTLNNKSDETFIQAHIHKAPAGTNGPIHWDFFLLADPDLVGPHPELSGVASPRAAAVLADLIANPDQYYVNVHSTAFPGGAVRGQLP
jgi:hypothetical protein